METNAFLHLFSPPSLWLPSGHSWFSHIPCLVAGQFEFTLLNFNLLLWHVMDGCMFCGTSDRGPYLSVVDSHFLRLEILLESHLRGNYLASASLRFGTRCHVLFIFSAFRSACNCNFSSRSYEERLIVVSVVPGSF